MRLIDSFRTATLGLRHARLRSFLTMLGIVIGIASVIILMSIGDSAQKLIISQVQSLGSNLVFVLPGASKGSKYAAPASVQGVIIKTMNQNDYNALKREPIVKSVAPQVNGQARVVYGNNDTSASFQGVPESFFEIRDMKAEKGFLFTKTDVDSLNRVVVIGSELAKTLFDEKDPIGKSIRLKNVSFRVVGVLEKLGVGPLGVDQDNIILIPISIAQKQLLGIDYYHLMTIQADDRFNNEFVISRISSVLRRNHRITDPNKDDFIVRSQEDAISLLGDITSIMAVFLTSIACISLIVGGIGIMNIMLVSVTERTREIGLRKAVGASNKDVMQQFLIEAVFLTFVGGLIGITIGAIIITAIYFILSDVLPTGWAFSLPLNAVLIAVFVSTLTGLVFGIYPARQASQKSPIDALRYE